MVKWVYVKWRDVTLLYVQLIKDFLVIPIQFDNSFGESLLIKLKKFYIEKLFPKLIN